MSDTLTIPDALPVLSVGNHKPGSGRACIMDAISILSGRDYDQDHPANVLPVLRPLFIWVNDMANDAERQELWPLGIRAMGTAVPDDPGTLLIDHKVGVSLLVIQAVRLLGNDNPAAHTEGVNFLQVALSWLHSPNYQARMSAFTIPNVYADVAHCRGCHFARHAARAVRGMGMAAELLQAEIRGRSTHPERMRFLAEVMDDVDGVLGTARHEPDEAAWQHTWSMLGTPAEQPAAVLTTEQVASLYGVPLGMLQGEGTWSVTPSSAPTIGSVTAP